MAQAKKVMIDAIRHDLETEFKDEYKQGIMTIGVAHTRNDEAAIQFKEEITNEFKDVKFTYIDPLSLSVACHIGPGALAVCIAQNKYINRYE